MTYNISKRKTLKEIKSLLSLKRFEDFSFSNIDLLIWVELLNTLVHNLDYEDVEFYIEYRGRKEFSVMATYCDVDEDITDTFVGGSCKSEEDIYTLFIKPIVQHLPSEEESE